MALVLDYVWHSRGTNKQWSGEWSATFWSNSNHRTILHGWSLVSYSLRHQDKLLYTYINGTGCTAELTPIIPSLVPLVLEQTFHPQFCEYKVAAINFISHLLLKVHAKDPLWSTCSSWEFSLTTKTPQCPSDSFYQKTSGPSALSVIQA